MSSLQVYLDMQADVHAGDTVRYIQWDYATRGKFHGLAGTVTELRGTGALGIHFPHHAKGTNLVAVADYVRLVHCPHLAAARQSGKALEGKQA